MEQKIVVLLVTIIPLLIIIVLSIIGLRHLNKLGKALKRPQSFRSSHITQKPYRAETFKINTVYGEAMATFIYDHWYWVWVAWTDNPKGLVVQEKTIQECVDSIKKAAEIKKKVEKS